MKYCLIRIHTFLLSSSWCLSCSLSRSFENCVNSCSYSRSSCDLCFSISCLQASSSRASAAWWSLRSRLYPLIWSCISSCRCSFCCRCTIDVVRMVAKFLGSSVAVSSEARLAAALIILRGLAPEDMPAPPLAAAAWAAACWGRWKPMGAIGEGCDEAPPAEDGWRWWCGWCRPAEPVVPAAPCTMP